MQTIYVDGQMNRLIPSRVLNIQRNPTNVIIGSMRDTGTAYGPTGSVAIGRMRIHDGCLSAADVNYNWMQEQAQFIATPTPTASITASASSTQVASLSPTGSVPPTPSVTPCPQAFSFTHVHKAVSFQVSTNTGQYFRHACYWIFASPNFPVTDLVASGDATQIVRLGLDGAPGTLSFQSSNYPTQYLAVQPDGYLYYDTVAEMRLTPEGRARASWYMDKQADGTYVLRSRSMAFFNQTAGFGTANAHGCASYTENLRVNNVTGWQPIKWNIVDPLAPPASYPAVSINDNVLVEPLGARGLYAQSCGGGVVARSETWFNTSTSFTIVPPVGCPTVCNGQTLSLRQAAGFITVGADGSLSMTQQNLASASATSASLVARRETVDGVTGWVISSYADYSAGNVLTVSNTCGSGAKTLALAPIPATGLSVNQLFRRLWADGSGDVTAVPPAPAIGSQPDCPTISNTPVPTITPSATASASTTSTPSITGSITATPPVTNSPGASPTNTPTLTSSPSTTATNTASITSSPSNTQTAAATPTSTPPVRIAGRLLVELHADDYLADSTGAVWDNRATAGTPSLANGDFVTPVGGTANGNPSYGFVGPLSVGAIVFDARTDGIPKSLDAGFAAFPTTSIYGQSDWTVEM